MPPYHAELNSIELIWAMLKVKVARSNLTLKKKDVGWLDDFILNVRVNNFSVMLGRSHHFLGITSTLGE